MQLKLGTRSQEEIQTVEGQAVIHSDKREQHLHLGEPRLQGKPR